MSDRAFFFVMAAWILGAPVITFPVTTPTGKQTRLVPLKNCHVTVISCALLMLPFLIHLDNLAFTAAMLIAFFLPILYYPLPL